MVLLFLIYWIFWVPGPRVGNDFSLTSQSLLKSMFNMPQTWSVSGTEGLGEYTVFTLWSYPFNLLTGTLANLGLSFEVLERVLIIIPLLFFGVLSIWKYCDFLKFSNYAKSISTIFYLTNTYILLLIDGGQLTIGLTYTFFPYAFLTIEKSLKGGFKKRILAALLVSIVGVFDVRFIFVLLLLCLIRFVFEFLFLSSWKSFEWIIRWIKTAVTIIPIYIGLNFYWLLVLFESPISSSTFANLTQTTFVSFISLGHSILLLSPHWFKNVFGNITQLRFEFFLIPVLVFLAPILRPKNKIVSFWLLVAIIYIFLTKGTSEPFSNLYQWLYSNVPGFSLFRDSTKFFFLICLSYTVLIGITVDELGKRFQKAKIIFVILITAYLILLIRPVWMGKMTGTFSSQPLNNEYLQLNKIFESDKQSSKVFWIPTIAPLTTLDESHSAVEAARLVQKRTFGQASVGTYEFFNFLREAPYMGQLFDVSGIGYLVYPNLDPRRDNMHPDNIKYHSIFSDQLSKLPWLSKVENSTIPLWTVNHYQERLFITPNIWWVIGSDDIYKEATKSSELALSKNSLIFAEDLPGLGKRIDELSFAKIVLFHKTMLDLAASFIEQDSLIFPAKNLKYDPNASGWWMRGTSDLIKWKDFLKEKYRIDNQDFDLNGGWAVAEKNLELKVKSEKLKKDQILLARVLESTRSGSLSFYQDNELVGQINTKSPGDNVRWFEIGSLVGNKDLTIKTQGEINVVNALALLPASLWQEYKAKAKGYQDRVVNFGKEAQEANSSVSYKQINPTKYIVTVKNLTQPAMLIFSQNFDNNWKLDGKSSLPVYSLLNGFSIDKNGEYELNFEPQKYILPGLVISILTLFASLFLLLV